MNYKLTSQVPGVRVFLTPNPLDARIELSETAERELALMIIMNELIDDVYSAHWELQTQRNMQDIKEGKDSPTREFYDAKGAKRNLQYVIDRWYGKDEETEEKWDGELGSANRWLLDKRVKMWIKELNTEHGGDCTCAPCSCTRCHAESLLGINTLPSSNKHVNSRMKKLWFDEFATPEMKEEKRKQAAEWAKKYPTKQWIPDEITKKRWDEEDKIAQEVWTEHKRLYQEQESMIQSA